MQSGLSVSFAKLEAPYMLLQTTIHLCDVTMGKVHI